MIRGIITVFSCLAILYSAFLLPTSAAKPAASESGDVPETNGTYDDPKHPGVKVRVFVHKEKNTEKPNTSIQNLLVCGLSDPDSTAVIGDAGWRLPPTVSYNLNPSSVPSTVGGANLATIVSNGFSDWTGAIGGKVSLVIGGNTTKTKSSYDGVNVIAWGRTSGSTLGVTYIRYYTISKQVVDVDTIMNSRVGWRWSNSSVCADSSYYDAENVMTHELGHWFGLDDEYDNNDINATMYGYASKGEAKKNTLTTGDVAGINALYP